MSLAPQVASRPRGRTRAARIVAAILLVLSVALIDPAAYAAAPRRQPITVGAVTLPACGTSPLAWCKKIQVPFDYTDPAAGTTGVYLEWYPVTGGSAVGTVLTVQGGPGYASTDYRDDYLKMLGNLTASRNVLIVDLRGTGRSDAINCAGVQTWTPPDGNQAYIDAVGACATQLNTARQRSDGSYVRGAELYTTANAARDLATVIDRLQTGPVDYYGDSYGTYIGQVFTSRYADKLRSVTLDAAYPVLGADPFYPDSLATAKTAFNKACNRSAACTGATSGQSWSRLSALVDLVRAHPFSGATKDPGGTNVTATVDVDAMVQLVQAAGSDNGVYRELDPAVRAYTELNDATALLRLVAQTVDNTSDSGLPEEFSAGLYEANACNDYPQPFSYNGNYGYRQAQYQAAVGALPADQFAPFTVAEWTTSPVEEFNSCLRWPKPTVDDPPIVSGTPIAPPDLPVMVFSGELDSLTTPVEGQRVAAQMGPSARWIQIGNMIHVSAMLDFIGCAEGLVQTFIRHPNQLMSMDAGCAANMPETRVVGTFPTTLVQATPATATAGNTASADARRLAAIGAAAVGDGIWHWWYIPGNKGNGLRGGNIKFAGADPFTVTFTNVKWTTDTSVNGTATWNQSTGHVTASVTVTGPGGLSATLTIAYDDYAPGGVATLGGTSDGKTIAATVPNP